MVDEREKQWVLWFDQVGNKDVGIVGGKNASLGEMYTKLTSQGVRVPNGFCVTSYSYFEFVRSAGIEEKLTAALQGLDKNDTQALARVGSTCRSLIMGAEFPEALAAAIETAYAKLGKDYGDDYVDVAVRSSATSEDLPEASFAGQQESFLNITGAEALLYATKRCMASLYTNRAISYRIDKGYDKIVIGLSVGVQKMVRSDMASSGVMFTLDTESGFRDVSLITGAWGLGENVVGGVVNPDEFLVYKHPQLAEQAVRPIVKRKLGSKELRMIYAPGGTRPVKNTHVVREDQERFCINDDEVLELARWGVQIENHYKRPMDIEWAKDGKTNELFIVQARPETVHSQSKTGHYVTFKVDEAAAKAARLLVMGRSVGSSIACGVANVIRSVNNMHEFQDGAILVTDMTDPDWEPVLKRAGGVITNRGGRTCHAAIISRELGISCIVGTESATQTIRSGQTVTVDCSRGDDGYVLEGKVPFTRSEVAVENVPQLRSVKLGVNLANPEHAFGDSLLPAAGGVGLCRMEFIINNHIRAHPLALLDPSGPNVSAADQEVISKLTVGYASGREYFVDRLACGVGTICAAFHPRRVILRFSDFKTDEYSNLLGGRAFEPEEANPMLGWRGSSRYYDPRYKAAFALECEAVRKVREVFGLQNLDVMVPFCRTVEEGRKVITTMAESGLARNPADARPLQIMCMCEIPSNVILAEEFLEIFDGFSIGSNDLTQLTLGVDRNSATVAHVFDERNEAVRSLIARVITTCKNLGKYVGICGQAPSDYPEFCEFLLEQGIDTISLIPDSVLPTTIRLAKLESAS